MRIFSKAFIALALMCGGNLIYAQQKMPPMPIDKNVRIGKLENGLTYYIRHNGLQEKQADFYIAQKVGSILEEDSQRGLAHFLEHMCFNGTTNFPDNLLREWLESIGVKFGANLNAYTSVDETVYNISDVPVIRDGIIDSCLLILHDWANDLTLDDKEIDKERGVIHEEWRTRTGAMMRMYEKVFPEIYKDSKYAYRLPIGIMEVVDNFPYQVLKDYYAKWYRPDQQGIMVVGDIDVDDIEARIKSIFSSIKMPENAAERKYFEVPDNDEPIITVASDREQQIPFIYYFHKHESVPREFKNNMMYLAHNYMVSIAESMLNNRLRELVQKPNPPFIEAGVEDGNFFVAKTKDAFFGVAVSKEDGIINATETLAREIERVNQFGFTATEYARSKADYLSSLESAYNERNNQKNETYIKEYVSHFIDNEPIPGLDNEYAIMSQIIPNIPVEAVNQTIQQMIGDKNIVLSVFCPEKEGFKYPTKEELKAVIDKVKTEKLTPYVDKVSNEPLMKEKPQGGKVVKQEAGAFGSTILTLSNGVKVVVKPTEYKADQILMSSISAGGTSVFDEKDALQFNVMNSVVELGGLGNFNVMDLNKVLAGKMAQVSSTVNTYSEGVSGKCAPKDFETMLQLTYLKFTAPRMDQDAFNSFIARNKSALANMEVDPKSALSDTINVALYNHNPRMFNLKAHMLDDINYNRVMELYKDRFADASDFTFFMVGNIDLEKATPLIEQYLGALPSTNRKENFRDVNLGFRKGQYENNFVRELETPKSTVLIINSGKCKYNLKNKLMMNILGQLLNMVYLKTVREDEGGTYGVSCSGSITKYPVEDAVFQIYFDTDPSKREKMVGLINEGIDEFISKGADDNDLKKVKEFMLKNFQQNQIENVYWINVIDDFYWYNLDNNTKYEETLKSITIKDIQKFAKKFFKQNNRIEVSMSSPVEKN